MGGWLFTQMIPIALIDAKSETIFSDTCQWHDDYTAPAIIVARYASPLSYIIENSIHLDVTESTLGKHCKNITNSKRQWKCGLHIGTAHENNSWVILNVQF